MRRGNSGSISRIPLWFFQRSRTAGNGRSTTKTILMVLTCLLLGYSIARLYNEQDSIQDSLVDVPISTDVTVMVQYDKEDTADHDQSSHAAAKADPIKVSKPVDHSLDLPRLQASRRPKSQSLYSQVTSNLGKLSDWTKSRLTTLTGSNDDPVNSTVHHPTSSASSKPPNSKEPVLGGDEVIDYSPDLHGDTPTIGKVSIITGDQPSNRLYERALRTHFAHNRMHNYQMFTLRESILDDVWTKPAYILSIILRELAKPAVERLKWLLWVDADTIILNPHIPAELFLPPDTAAGDWDDIHMLVTYDWNGLNNGVFPIRVHSWSVSLLSAILAFRHYRPDATLTFRDQSAMAMLIEEPAFRKHVMHAPQRWYNAYRGEINETIAPFQFRRGDFLVHFAGDPERDEHMRYWLERAEQHADEWEVALKYTTYPSEVKEFWHAAALEKSARQQARADAVRSLDALIAKVGDALTAHAAQVGEPVRIHVESVLERMHHVLADAESSTKAIKDAHDELEKEGTIVMGHAAASLAETVKAAHEAIFDAEHVLFADVFTDQLKAEIQAVEDQLQQLRLKLQHEPLREDQIVTATTYLVELVVTLETRIEALQNAEDAAAETHVSSVLSPHADATPTMQVSKEVASSPADGQNGKVEGEMTETTSVTPSAEKETGKKTASAMEKHEGKHDEKDDSQSHNAEVDRIKAAEKDAADNWEKVKPGLPLDG